jgi:hypothetical protein
MKVMTDTARPGDAMPKDAVYQDVEVRSVVSTFSFNDYTPRRCRPRCVDSGAHPGTFLQAVCSRRHEQGSIKAPELLPAIGVVDDLKSSGPLGVHGFHVMELYSRPGGDYETIAA